MSPTLIGWNGQSLTEGDSNINYSVDTDKGCQNGADSEQYQIYTRLPSMLPIVDVQMIEELYTVAINEVCYA